MTWWLMWLNGSVVTLNTTFHILIIYRLEEIYMKECLSLHNGLPTSTTNLEQLKLVICDEERAKFWEPIKEVLINLEVKLAEDINLTWLLKP